MKSFIQKKIYLILIWIILINFFKLHFTLAQEVATEPLPEAEKLIGTGGAIIETPRPEPVKGFGYDRLSINPEMVKPLTYGVDGEYVISPGDSISISLVGDPEFFYVGVVRESGAIRIPLVNADLQVGGLRFENLHDAVREIIWRRYRASLGSDPASLLDVAVVSQKYIAIVVDGAAEITGEFKFRGTTNVFQVLASAKPTGTLRAIQLIRSGRLVHTIDVYDYLIYNRPETLYERLQDGDRLYIPPLEMRVTVQGAVENRAIFEPKSGETWDIIVEKMARLHPQAYTQRIELNRIFPNEGRKILSVAYDSLKSRPHLFPAPRNGDILTIPFMEGQPRNLVYVLANEPYLLRLPGPQPWSPGMRARDAIMSAELLDEISLNVADLIRPNPMARSVRQLNLQETLTATGSLHNPFLEVGDTLYVYSNMEFLIQRKIFLNGAVNAPGSYPYYEGLTVSSALRLYGKGFSSEAYVDTIEVLTPEFLPGNFEIQYRLQKSAVFDLYAPRETTPLLPGARIIIRKDPRFIPENSVVEIVGKGVEVPGFYARNAVRNRFSDLIRAARLTAEADTAQISVWKDGIKIVIDAWSALQKPGSVFDVEVPINARIDIPEKDRYVQIEGPAHIVRSGKIAYVEGWNLQQYFEIAIQNWKHVDLRQVRVRYPDSTYAKRPSRLTGLFVNEPEIVRGSTIIIPGKGERR